MRTTITLEPDVYDELRRFMTQKRISFKEAVNAVMRDGLGRMAHGQQSRFVQRTYDMGEAAFNLDKALQLAGELEDEEIVRKMALRK